MSNFCTLFSASRIRPSDEINSVYIRSAPFTLQTDLNGGSLTSSIGASNKGKSPKSILPIFIKCFILTFLKNQFTKKINNE